ncbi:MAG: GNAT family N-acetyltransferase [Candidatus Omnitrophica bacterium]|nr:GNAT family N-acetyltransferase [Candidatus Omnitrophota bacterium]
MVTIRPYQKNDREIVRTIAWETAFMGGPGSLFFGDKEILADFLTLYFTDHEPQSCFVAEDEAGEVVGYILGATDTKVLNSLFFSKIFPKLLLKAFFRGTFFAGKNLRFLWSVSLSFIKGELRVPDFSCKYPATLHINLKQGARRQGVGAGLMQVYLSYLAEKKIAGVHMAAMSDKGVSFFKKEGFLVLYQGRRSYFRHLLKKDLDVFVFGRMVAF